MKLKNLLIWAVIAYVIYRYMQFGKSPAAAQAAAAGQSPAQGFLYNLAGISFAPDAPLTPGVKPSIENGFLPGMPPPLTKPPIYEGDINGGTTDTTTTKSDGGSGGLVSASDSTGKSKFTTVFVKTPFVNR